MNGRLKKLIPILIAVSMILSGCANNSPTESQTTTSVETTVTTTKIITEITTETKEIQEEPYMEQFKDIITELPPEGYEETLENVAYSEFKKYTYYSSTAGRDTNVNVLLPPNYSDDKEYPVVYIMHGFYDNEGWMTRPVVNLKTIYGNLLANGEAEEMIIVLPYIFCDKNMPYCTGMDLENCFAYDNFINDLTTDLMPFIESEFSVAKGRENTAITGFSMGGRESLFIGFKRPDLFGYIGSVCAAPGLVEVPGSAMHPGQMTKEEMTFAENIPYLIFVSSSESDGVVGSSPDTYRKIMTRNEVEYLSHVMKSTGHDHTSVKPHLYNFFKMLFK